MAARGDRGDRTAMTSSRRIGVVAAGVCAAVLATFLGRGLTAPAAARMGSDRAMPALGHEVLGAVNAFRVAHHLVPLRESPRLARAARQHSREMARVGYFAHESADGSAFWRRIERYYGSRGYLYWTVGENLLWAAPGVTATSAMKMWIASPEHLRNLLTPQWRRIGVSVVHVRGAPGVYHGLDITIVTTDFGARR
jgi:uncharacterized protein YkwD